MTKMSLLTGAAIAVGIIVSLLSFVNILWFIPKFPRVFKSNPLVVFPMACIPAAVGLLLTELTAGYLALGTSDSRNHFTHIWLGIAIVLSSIFAAIAEKRKQTDRYWQKKPQ